MINNSKLFAAFAVVALTLCVFAVVADMDKSDAAGSGTESDPYSGTLTSSIDLFNENITYYIEQGTVLDITGSTETDGADFIDNKIVSVTSGFGLSFSSHVVDEVNVGRVTGTVSGNGSFTISVDYADTSGTSSRSFEFVSVSSEGDIDFTSPEAVDAISGSSISYQATTNVDGVTFSKDGGNASWLTLTSAGRLTGTAPSVSEKTDYTFGIKASSPGGQNATQTVTFTVYPVAKLTVSPSSVSGTVGAAIGTVTVSSNIPCTFNMDGKLPAGLSFSSGKISGTPTSAGNVTVKIYGYSTEGPSQTASVEIPVSISEGALEITSQPPTGIFKVGSPYTYNLTANQSVTWSLVGAPSWLAVDSDRIVGSVPATYTSSVTETFQVKATTSGGQEKVQSITVSIEPILEFTSKPTASCVVTPVYGYDKDGNPSIVDSFRSMMTLGADLSAEPVAMAEGDMDYTAPDAVDAITGAKFTYNAATNITGTTFSKVSGADWLSITSAGVVTGTAPSVTQVTDHQIVIKATSPKGQTIEQTVTITVYPVAQLTSSALSTQVHLNSQMATVTVTSNVAVTWSTQGDIPAGVTFSDGVFSGTPTVQGSFSITVFGTTTAGPSQTASVKVTIVVGEPVLQITSTAPADLFKVGQQYSYTPAANVDGVTWSITGDGITDWLAVSGGNVIGQVPSKYTDATTVTFTLKAVSPEKQEATQTVTIDVEPIIEWTSVPTAACVVQPVYDYSDDGSYKPTASRMSLFGPDLSADPVIESDGENTAITETGTRTFRFTWTGENAECVIWDFGDGETAEGFSVIHTYGDNGTYTYKCTGINDLGESSVTGKITVDVDDGFDYSMIVLIAVIVLIVVASAVILKRRKSLGRRY